MKLNKKPLKILNEKYLLIREKIKNSFELIDEEFLKKNFCDKETLFQICLSSFEIPVNEREEMDIKFIFLYMSKIKKFINLLKNEIEDNQEKQLYNKNNNYIKLLKNLSENILYENYPKNIILMRYGEKLDKFYIILQGLISIMIPFKFSTKLTFFEYNRYIALLILYKEFELAKITIKENNLTYNVDLPDMKYIIKYINQNSKEVFKHSTKNLNRIPEEIDENDKMRIENFMVKYLTKNELRLFVKIKNGQNSEIDNVNPQNYINRFKNIIFNAIKYC